jgi:hypothetical protein
MGDRPDYAAEQFGRGSINPADQGSFERDLVFIIMPFTGRGMDAVYSAIKDECHKLDLKPCRVDEHTGAGVILRDITDLIRRAEFIICDLTDERPNVYYELGYAHGVGNWARDTLLVARKGTKLHFDIAGLQVRYYYSTENLRYIIAKQLSAMLEKTRGEEAKKTKSPNTAPAADG